MSMVKVEQFFLSHRRGEPRRRGKNHYLGVHVYPFRGGWCWDGDVTEVRKNLKTSFGALYVVLWVG